MTKKIAAVAANGKAGHLIAKESAERGIDVTAFVRSASKAAAEKAVVKDIMGLTAEDLAGFDAVVDAFVAWTPETLDQQLHYARASLRLPLWHQCSLARRRRCRFSLCQPQAHLGHLRHSGLPRRL